MDVAEAIRKRRAVRNYLPDPIPDDVLDRVLRQGLRAPTGSGAQAWSFLVVRDEATRRQLADIIIDGAGRYFAIMRPKKDGASDEEHVEWGREYAKEILASYRDVPVWVLAIIVPRGNYPAGMEEGGHIDDTISVAFAFQNLMLAARAEGLGTCPTTAFWRLEIDRLRALLDLPGDVEPLVITPMGYPKAFPTGRPPALRNFREWRTLVHDDRYGAVRETGETTS